MDRPGASPENGKFGKLELGREACGIARLGPRLEIVTAGQV